MEPKTGVSSLLSAEQCTRFARDGYVCVPGLFDSARMADIARWTQELVDRPERPGTHMVYYEDDLREPGRRVLSRIENFCPFHEGFDGLLRESGLTEQVGALFGEPALLFKDKINFKLPGGDGFKAHQDVQAGWDDYASLHITVLISIDDATPENGCLELAPGRHREGMLGERWEPLPDPPPEAGQPSARARAAITYETVPTRRGDVVFFDSYAPHRSAPNRTDEPRRVLYITYNKASEGDHRVRYFADKRASYPPDCEREPGKDYRFKV